MTPHGPHTFSFRPGMAGLALAASLLLSGCGNGSDSPPPIPEGPGAPPVSYAPGTPVTETFSLAPAAPVSGPTFRESLAAGHAHLAFLFVPSSGFAYRDGEGRLTGVTVELLRDFARFVADTHGLEVAITWIEEELWAAFYGFVRDSEGGVFGIGNVTITDARWREIDFSPPYLQNVAVLVTHQDVPELESMESIGEAFAGLTALPYPGTLHEARLEAIREAHFPLMAFRPVASNDELVAALSEDPGTFGYLDIYNYWRAREGGLPLRRHPVGDDAAETFGVILPDGSDWTPVILAFFEAQGGYTESQRFRGLLGEHLGEELAALLSGGKGGR